MSMFNALNGAEALEVVLAKIRKSLESTGEFRQNIAFPMMRFDYDVKFWVYPKQPLTGTPSINAQGGEGELPKEGAPSTIQVTDTNLVDTPDKARLEANLDIPKPTITPGGIVDIRQDQPKVEAKSITIPIKDGSYKKGDVLEVVNNTLQKVTK